MPVNTVFFEKNNNHNKFRAFLSLIFLVLWAFLIFPIYFFVHLLLPKKVEHVYMAFHNVCCKIFSMQCDAQGKPSKKNPSLFLANHSSYLDIFILGGFVPACFIAKSEVASWPVIGWIAKLQNTLFFERKGNKVKEQISVMSNYFDNGGNLILFPEGQTTDGASVKPFKSSLLQSVESAGRLVYIQPVTISYTHYQGKAMDRSIRDHYAWYDGAPFFSHFWRMLGMGKARVKVIFHDPVLLSDFHTRKDCSHYCWHKVSIGLNEALEAE